MATINFITNQEFRDATPGLNLDLYTPATLSGLINRSTARVEGYLEYTLQKEDLTEKVQGYINPDNDLVLHTFKKPINSLSAVEIVKGNFTADITLTTGGDPLFDILDERYIVVPGSTITLNTVSVINYASLKRLNFWVNVTFNGGFEMNDRPADLIDAVILYCRDEYSRTFNNAGARSISQGGVSMTWPTGGQRSQGKSDFILDANRILDRHKNLSGW